MKGSTKRNKTTKRNKRNKYSRRNRTVKRGGFRYGKSKKHTPIPGEVLISSPRTKTRTRTKTRKYSSLF
jgi:hypothetical protein